jgi:high-affinity Fe2+/Pb2+ permease
LDCLSSCYFPLSLGLFGLALAFAFFGIIVWWLIDSGLLGLENTEIVTYIALFILSAVLATGMSWSHIRRRLSGQADMDDIDE